MNRKKGIQLNMLYGISFAMLLSVGGCANPGKTGEEQGKFETVAVSAKEDIQKEETKQEVHQPVHVKQTETSLNVSELENQAFFTDNVFYDGKEVRLFVLPADKENIQVMAAGEGSAFGKPGDRRYEGELLFYLADAAGEEAYLQDTDSASYSLNLSNEPFTVRKVGSQSILQIAEIVQSNGRELTLFVLDQGLLHAVSVDGERVLYASTEKVKVVEDLYLQTYLYFNGEPLGWQFQTYEWHPDEKKLSLINERELFIEDEWKEDSDWYGEGFADEMFDTFKGLIDKWHEIDSYVDPFPYRIFPDNLADRLKNGYILDEQLKVGLSMTAYKAKYPLHLGEYEAEGGSYFSYPDGQNVFYDDYNGNVYGIELRGSYYKDTTSRLKQLLGEHVSDSADYPMSDEDKEAIAGTNYDTGDILDYEIDGYHVKVEYEGEEVIGIYLHGGG